ncbi:MAG: hypothetical protein IJZ26_00930, partial [Clostridia bacterium]|nr:hypothetical protein [Clostridia bacterium]
NGEFSKISFIKRIENKNGLVLYEHNKETSQVFSSETAYLINDVLQDTKTIGTAKKLSNYTNWAVKTGTAGSGNNTNTDAWCVAYSNNYTVCSWVGNTSGNPNNNLSQTQNGGNLGASFCKIALNQLPNQTEFITPENITKVALDNIELKSNNKLLLASDKLPKRYIVEEIFNKKYAPTTVADNYIQLPPPVLKGKLKENQISLTWENQPLVFYEIYGKNARFEKLIYTTEENISTYNYDNSEYNFDTFYIVAKYKNSDISSKSNELKFYLHKNNLSNNVQKIRKNWFY